jgi:serine/threonine-protein kinase
VTELRTLAHRYRPIRTLGEGAGSVVQLAEDLRDGTRVAVKVLPAAASRDPVVAARLAREAVATSAIEHPNVVRTFDVGSDPDGSTWLAMEWVDGRSLRDVIDEGALPPESALRIVRGILEALAAAHAVGIVHRDIKPENVMIPASGGEAKVLDFGIAKLDPQRHAAIGPGSVAGIVHGTPTYMAPEQIRHEPVDGRTDLYAVGVMLFEMIAGAPPFDGDDLSILAQHLGDPPPALSSPVAPEALTLALRAFVARLMAKNREARPASAIAAIAELDDAAASIASSLRHLETASLRTGALAIPLGTLPPRPTAARTTPAKTAQRTLSIVRRKTARMVAFARSYGLEPRQLLLGFAVAFALILLFAVVAFTGGPHG